MYISETKPVIRPLWLWPNLLSLDAPLIAVLWLNLFAHCAQVELSPAVSLTLALVVWLIYASDRLLDSLHLDSFAISAPRHRFHGRHRRTFIAIAVAALVLTCLACLTLSLRTFWCGSALMAAVGTYLILAQRMHSRASRWFPKEALVGVLFGAGTTLPVWTHLSAPRFAIAICCLLFVSLVWLNAVLIEYTEWIQLRSAVFDTPHQTTIAAGKNLAVIAIALAALPAALIFVGVGAGQFRDDFPILLALALSAAALATLAMLAPRLRINAIRVLADVALLTPVLMLSLLHR